VLFDKSHLKSIMLVFAFLTIAPQTVLASQERIPIQKEAPIRMGDHTSRDADRAVGLHHAQGHQNERTSFQNLQNRRGVQGPSNSSVPTFEQHQKRKQR
jgi:hypothetical protein